MEVRKNPLFLEQFYKKKILGFSFPLKSIQAQKKWVELYPFTY